MIFPGPPSSSSKEALPFPPIPPAQPGGTRSDTLPPWPPLALSPPPLPPHYQSFQLLTTLLMKEAYQLIQDPLVMPYFYFEFSQSMGQFLGVSILTFFSFHSHSSVFTPTVQSPIIFVEAGVIASSPPPVPPTIPPSPTSLPLYPPPPTSPMADSQPSFAFQPPPYQEPLSATRRHRALQQQGVPPSPPSVPSTFIPPLYVVVNFTVEANGVSQDYGESKLYQSVVR